MAALTNKFNFQYNGFVIQSKTTLCHTSACHSEWLNYDFSDKSGMFTPMKNDHVISTVHSQCTNKKGYYLEIYEKYAKKFELFYITAPLTHIEIIVCSTLYWNIWKENIF